MLIERAWIAAHLPHGGAMCLLDGVLDWDESRVRCVSGAHRNPANPLRAHGRLGAACGIEFCAQAMAVHGALLARDPPAARRVGYLASVRAVTLHTDRLDDVAADLVAHAERLGGDEATILYGFSLRAGTRTLVTGRAAVVMAAATAQAAGQQGTT